MVTKPQSEHSKELVCIINHLDDLVRREYAKFTTDLLSLLERNCVPVAESIFQVAQLDMGPLTNDMKLAADNRAFLIALKHTQSWYDFSITASLAESLGGDDGIKLVKAYERKLKSNLQRRRRAFKTVNPGQLVIKFNDKRDQFTDDKREKFETVIMRLMSSKDKKKELILRSIREGCVEVTYLIPLTVAPAIKRTIGTLNVVDELRKYKVISVSLDK